MTTSTAKRKVSPAQLANLNPLAALKEPEQRRTAYASARRTRTSKEKLSAILIEMDLSLADLLEKIAYKEVEIIEK